MFHNTIFFFNKSLDEAKNLLNLSKEEIADATVISLISAFEHTVFLYAKQSIEGKAHGQESIGGGLNEVIKRFKPAISPRTYEDTELLCQYRHWVAHGKRWDKPTTADPVNTHKCLTDFLTQADLT